MWRARKSIAPIYILKLKLSQKNWNITIVPHPNRELASQGNQCCSPIKTEICPSTETDGSKYLFPRADSAENYQKNSAGRVKIKKTEGNKTQVGQECEAQVVKNILQFFSSKVPLHTQGSPGGVLRKHCSWLGLGKGERNHCSRAQDPTCIFLLWFLWRTKILTGVGRRFLVTLGHW